MPTVIQHWFGTRDSIDGVNGVDVVDSSGDKIIDLRLPKLAFIKEKKHG